ncbi:MAG: CDP-alcohol phosphatidyltransferase family protein [bacterium]|nr:CDP-alcohol phosphatidyltransferase family protein [bacterium]
MIDYLQSIDPFWISLIPLIAFNTVMLAALAFFAITYDKRIKQTAEVNRKRHTKILSGFLKEWWYWILTPIEKIAIRFKITPNAFTFLGLPIAALSAYFFYKGMIGLGGWVMIFGASCDLFDGRIARLTGKSSEAGAFFDSVMDRFGEAVVFLGLAGLYRDSWVLYFVVSALVGSLMVSYVRARGEGLNVVCSGGLMQRPERIVYLGVGSILSPILAYSFSSYIQLPFDFLTITAIVFIAVMTNSTAVYRMFYIIKRLPKADDSFRFLNNFPNS